MTDPVQPFLDQVEEVRTKEGIVPKGSKDIISRAYYDESVFAVFYFFENEEDYEMFKYQILNRKISVLLNALEIKSSGNMLHPGHLLIVTLNDDYRTDLRTSLDNTNTWPAFLQSTIGEELTRIVDDLGHNWNHAGGMLKREYLRLIEKL